MKKILLSAALFWSAFVFCAAQSALLPAVADLLPRQVSYEAGQFFVVVDTGHGTKPVLKPLGFASDAPSAAADSDRALRIEALVVLPAPRGSKPAEISALPDTMLILTRILNSVSTMEGTEYWSASRRRMRTLYAEAYRVESASNRVRQPDPDDVPAVPGSSQVFYAFLRDLTFGGNVMKYDVLLGDSFIEMANENVTTVRYYLLPLASPGNMRSGLLVVPCREGLLVHFQSTIDAIDILEKRVFESAGNKSLAVLGWFAEQTAAAGLTQEPRLPKNIEEVKKFR